MVGCGFVGAAGLAKPCGKCSELPLARQVVLKGGYLGVSM